MKTMKELIHAVQFNGNHVINVPDGLQLIGQGRSAAVFRIVGSAKAVKVFYIDYQHLAETEGNIYQQLADVRYYPKLFEIGEGYIIIEYLEGITLYDCLVSGIPITPHMIADVDEALNFARIKGLNPSDTHLKNIMWTTDSQVKVIDVVRYKQEKECPHWSDLKKAYYVYYQKRLFPKRIPPFLIEIVIKMYRRRLLPI